VAPGVDDGACDRFRLRILGDAALRLCELAHAQGSFVRRSDRRGVAAYLCGEEFSRRARPQICDSHALTTRSNDARTL